MKIRAIILLCFLSLTSIYATTTSDSQTLNLETIFTEDNVDKFPLYQGEFISSSKQWFAKSLSDDLRYYTGGKFTIRFVIEKDGSISNIETIGAKKSLVKAINRAFIENPPKYSAAQKNGNAVRYAVAYDITVKAQGKYNSISVFNNESHVHTLNELETLPLLNDGRITSEYLDDIFASIIPQVEGTSKPISFNLVWCKDGTLSIAYLKGFQNSRASQLVKEIIKSTPSIQPPTKDGKSVSYVSKHVFSAERIALWKEYSFKSELMEHIANDKPIDIKFTETPPQYHNNTLAEFKNLVENEISQILKDKRHKKGDAKLVIQLGKDGKVKEIEMLSGSDNEMISTVISVLKTHSTDWSPARLYKKNVSCNINLSVSYER